MMNTVLVCALLLCCLAGVQALVAPARMPGMYRSSCLSTGSALCRSGVFARPTLLFAGSEFAREDPKPKEEKPLIPPEDAKPEEEQEQGQQQQQEGEEGEEQTAKPSMEEAEPPQISTTMRDKLRKELQSQGADPNYSAGAIKGNPILIISVIVAILVVAGGKDILY
ncbi:hypothetical protein B484DRAFT_454970 [Ochromonadaceae sp. CCMP2298]|nr:hypothetical protein B484DRAFT_454970 [Ochromonadaceae sp. CCMP2298]|mmetsp:Transcript_30460/g.67361  ORF Transcript_30460/g.67361 Transcript_30460/m.67361 type:complete len:167 (-) Transcript_30460:190-690(-)